MPSRREFLRKSAQQTTLAVALKQAGLSASAAADAVEGKGSHFHAKLDELLGVWVDGMIAHQILLPADPKMHGVLWCPACQKIHGRCMDAVYPFVQRYRVTGNRRYLIAAESVMDWSKNVSKSDGSWTVIPDPKSWAGTTVFGAIALAETLHHHHTLLPESRVREWTTRLEHAVAYVYRKFDLDFTNINYGISGLYALNFAGRLLGENRYIARSRKLAKGVPRYFTERDLFLFGEMKPSRKKSPKGLYGVDLGYNVEETLNGLVQYALLENDGELLDLAEASMRRHLDFMLPDGAWDNSWGSRQAKWSYWGSRTTDGCQIAYAMMNPRDPQFGAAALRNLELLERCTHNGLLHGGPHYHIHGIKPCIHHTFSHAKVPAALLDTEHRVGNIAPNTTLPLATLKGVKQHRDIAVTQISEGPWRASISCYDTVYRQDAQGATGASLGTLWHQDLGLICTASMVDYVLVERNNQQPQPNNEDIALAPRIEMQRSGEHFTNLWDRQAELSVDRRSDGIIASAKVQLRNREGKRFPGKSWLRYQFYKQQLAIHCTTKGIETQGLRFILPIVSPSGEVLDLKNEKALILQKPGGDLVVESSHPIAIRETAQDRAFNMVPGVQALVLDVKLDQSPLNITMRAKTRAKITKPV